MLKFHFQTFALCTVESCDGELTARMVGGLYASYEDAERGAEKIELDRRGHDEQCKAKHPEMRLIYRDPLPRQHYEIVPLANVEFKSLAHLEYLIEQAACLQFVGVGKVVA